LTSAATQFSQEHTLVVLLALDAGLRVSEICALEWSDVDLKGGSMLIQHNTYRGHKQTPKGTIGRIVLTAAVYSGEGALDVGADDLLEGGELVAGLGGGTSLGGQRGAIGVADDLSRPWSRVMRLGGWVGPSGAVGWRLEGWVVFLEEVGGGGRGGGRWR
jgi:hypothetical protein